jgi:hypothetical protein
MIAHRTGRKAGMTTRPAGILLSFCTSLGAPAAEISSSTIPRIAAATAAPPPRILSGENCSELAPAETSGRESLPKRHARRLRHSHHKSNPPNARGV